MSTADNSYNHNEEIRVALYKNEGNLGKAYRAMQDGAVTSTDLVNLGAAANHGAASNLQAVLKVLLQRKLPKYPSRAAQAARSIGGLLRDNPEITEETRAYLQNLRADLDRIINDEIANQQEVFDLDKASNALIADAEQLGGVYVYTFPTYLKIPIKLDPERFWLKIGMTERVVDLRIADQTRATAMPEDPIVLRVFRSSEKSNSDVEKLIHGMLDAAGHSRTEAKRGGREWFATNLEFLDQIAEMLDLQIDRAQDED